MSIKRLSAGDTIDSHCTRCRVIMNHTIVAMVEDRVARVKCNTCGGEHNYKPTKPSPSTTSRRTPVSPKAERKTSDKTAREWESLKVNIKPDEAIPYRMDGTFKLNDTVSHPTFGLGIVRSLPGAAKMEVLFEVGIKLLRCR